MIDKNIETFLEKTDLNYLFCLLAKLESQRLTQLPVYVRQRFPEKISVLSMEHVASNEVPDYFAEIEEANEMMAKMASPFADEDPETGEETFDDSEEHIEELLHDNLDRYSDEDDDEEFTFGDDQDDEEE
ncbi:MAG: hypothetical protein LHW45_05845 [Candidatus Cloacimonetes bacterium]|jgi:hypothetical protein|nr:hypothetical protein [Candidatus Cloacimonadota bacterium]MDY0367130.1 hypothetical protein [Candidatus Syntrophosphaera sp.]HOY84936.1 hypothetical protein [Candidatus Syntrophosphaera sp.]HPH60320.1 hypothetical protein [Candidatus Syntrophosphaera sp.]